VARAKKSRADPAPSTALVTVLDRHGSPLEGAPSDSTKGSIIELEIDGEARRYRLPDDLPNPVLETMQRLGLVQLPGEGEVIRIMTPQVIQSVDRATRGAEGWTLPESDFPRFEDPSNRHVIEIAGDGETMAAMRASVLALNPRVADVWRLITALSLEAWAEGESEPPPIWVDCRELLNAMGFEQHHKGGFRPEQVEAASRALETINNLWVVVPLGSRIYPVDPVSRKRKRRELMAENRFRVMVTLQKTELKDLFGTRYPLRWQVRPGPWIRDYPRRVAPMLKSLVELGAQQTAHVWAKALGTELTYLWRPDAPARRTVHIKTWLVTAGVFPEVERAVQKRNGARAREYFETTLDLMAKLGLYQEWFYDSEALTAMDKASRTERFDMWLNSSVVLVSRPTAVTELPPTT
jgi:hypothetical protein